MHSYSLVCILILYSSSGMYSMHTLLVVVCIVVVTLLASILRVISTNTIPNTIREYRHTTLVVVKLYTRESRQKIMPSEARACMHSMLCIEASQTHEVQKVVKTVQSENRTPVTATTMQDTNHCTN